MNLKVSRILHAGYVFECNQVQIAFDPIFENPFSHNCFAFPDVKFDPQQIKNLKFAAVFISHFHDDHCSFESLDLLNRNIPIYVYCLYEELFSMLRDLGFKQVYSLQINDPVTIGPFTVIPLRALDSEVDSIFHIAAAGNNILNVVDSWIDSETLDQLALQAPWDMVLWPFQTMREIEVLTPSKSVPAPAELPAEWIEQLSSLRPKYIVPSSCQFLQESWSWYNHAFFPISYRQFQQQIEIDILNTQVVRLDPGISVVLNKNKISAAERLPWIQPVGDQDVDYEYKSELRPPGTAVISRHFVPLSFQQAERVFEYCRSGLTAKFKTLEPSADEYFNKPRLWRLSVYDHLGEVNNFYYKIIKNNITPVLSPAEELSWVTEIPLAKFFAALENGETLTSLYMRINDILFAPEIENEIKAVDAVEDPLIRCLFTGEFGGYQRAQLKRIVEGRNF